MKYLKVYIRNASFNFPKEDLKKYRMLLQGLPYSTTKGLLYSILGERPPSRYSKITELFNIDWINRIAEKSKYKIYTGSSTDSQEFRFSGIPKIEEYYGRCSEHIELKNHLVDTYLMSNNTNFLKALKSIYHKNKAYEVMDLFRNDCQIIFNPKKNTLEDEIKKAENRYNQLLKMEADSKEKWKLSSGYLKIFQNRAWLKSPLINGGQCHLGIYGRPLKKITFDGEIIFPIISEYISKVENKVNKSSSIMTYGEGGIAWVPYYDGGGDWPFIQIDNEFEYTSITSDPPLKYNPKNEEEK